MNRTTGAVLASLAALTIGLSNPSPAAALMMSRPALAPFATQATPVRWVTRGWWAPGWNYGPAVTAAPYYYGCGYPYVGGCGYFFPYYASCRASSWPCQVW